jgi:predicted O-linked N-acetylglucosamine transferase (SPINDLY family)
MIANDLAAYEEMAIALAKDPKKHAALKRKLGENRNTTPLFDAPAFCKAIEAAYTRMIESARNGEAAKSFAVSAD